MKILKLIEPFSVVLRTGRTDVTTIELTPENDSIPYDSIVDSDVTSKLYNKLLIDKYVDSGILTILDYADATIVSITDIVESKVYEHTPAANGPGETISWEFVWPISVSSPIVSASLTATYIPDISTDTFTFELSNLTTTEITIKVSNPDRYNSAAAAYSTDLTINGTTVHPTITVEYTLLGS